MIGTRDIKVHAANPNIPLQPIIAFRGSPISIRLIDVPKKVGQWRITEVYVTAAYADNSIVTKGCVLVGGCWVGTLANTDSVGKTARGFTVTANGIDEDGNATKGYVLGVGDLVVLDRDATAAAERTSHYVHLFGEKPESPNEGDAYVEADIMNVFVNGSWFPVPDADSILQEVMDVRESSYTKDESDERFQPAGDYALQSSVDAVEDVIPAQASPENQLADKGFVNSSIVTNTAYFKGTFDSAAGLPQDRVTPNDYAFVRRVDGAGNTLYDRYKFTADGEWTFEYAINNSGFTAEQWATVNSGMTADDKARIGSIESQLDGLETILEGI